VPVNDADIKTLLDARISRARAKELLIALVKVPSPQTELLEDEPLLKVFITSAIEPRLRGSRIRSAARPMASMCGSGRSCIRRW
jgi:hypothetical protein